MQKSDNLQEYSLFNRMKSNVQPNFVVEAEKSDNKKILCLEFQFPGNY